MCPKISEEWPSLTMSRMVTDSPSLLTGASTTSHHEKNLGNPLTAASYPVPTFHNDYCLTKMDQLSVWNCSTDETSMQRWKYHTFSTGFGDDDGHNHQDLRTVPQQLAVATSPNGAMHLSISKNSVRREKNCRLVLKDWYFDTCGISNRNIVHTNTNKENSSKNWFVFLMTVLGANKQVHVHFHWNANGSKSCLPRSRPRWLEQKPNMVWWNSSNWKPSWCFQPIWKILVKMGIFPK